MRPALHLPLALLLGVLVRYPFWIEALRTPLDGDTSIVGLMALHPFDSLTLWGQPYGSPLESWLIAPALRLGPDASAIIRSVYFLLGLGLIPLAYYLGGALHPWAALPAATLLACPPPYLLLLSALPPPLYPVSLVLCGLLLLIAVRAGPWLETGPVRHLPLFVWGALAGLALWTHLMSASVVAASGLWLAWKARWRLRSLAPAVVGLLLAGAPLAARVVVDARSLEIVKLSGRNETFAEHVSRVLPSMHEPLGGLLGTHVPMIADDAEHVLSSDGWVRLGIVALYGLGSVLVLRAVARRPDALPLLAAVVLTLVAFPLPLRSGPAAIRFLTPLYLPLAVLLAWLPLSPPAGNSSRRGARRAFVLVLALACLHLAGGLRLLAAWRSTERADPPFGLVDLSGTIAGLDALGIRHAYASYGPAYRLTFQTRERIVASQPWNERFRHYPLPYLDEVRFAKNVAWILTPSIPTDLPPPHAFEAALGHAGGHARRWREEGVIVYHGFEPPFDPVVEPWPAGTLGDGSLETGAYAPPDRPTLLHLPAPRLLEAITLVAPHGAVRLPRDLVVEISADGETFETVARRQARGEREDLRWVNGHPQYVLDHDLIAIPLGGGRVVHSLRLTPSRRDADWALGELLLHPAHPETPGLPWAEWLDPNLTWSQRRRALADLPRPDREDWYYRSLLAARN